MKLTSTPACWHCQPCTFSFSFGVHSKHPVAFRGVFFQSHRLTHCREYSPTLSHHLSESNMLGQVHRSRSSRVCDPIIFRMSLTLRFDEILIINKSIRKFILYISLKIFIFIQHKCNCAITASISASLFPVFYNSEHINQLHSRLAIPTNTNSMFIYPQFFNLDVIDIV